MKTDVERARNVIDLMMSLRVEGSAVLDRSFTFLVAGVSQLEAKNAALLKAVRGALLCAKIAVQMDTSWRHIISELEEAVAVGENPDLAVPRRQSDGEVM